MKTSKVYTSNALMFLFIFLLSACGGGQPEIQSADEPIDYTAIEPEIIDLGYGAKLLIRGLPDDVALDVNIDLEIKNNIPDSRYVDNVHSEIAVVSITQNGGPATVDTSVVELCYTTTLTPGMDEQPVPFYWDTSNNPLLDGRPLRVSSVEKEPELVVCAMVETSGAYALIAR